MKKDLLKQGNGIFFRSHPCVLLSLLSLFLDTTECTKHIAPRHHAVIFFGLFFGVADYIFTQYVPAGTVDSNNGPLAMSKGSALSAMLWSAIIVYTTDRRWVKAALFCTAAACFAAIGLIHQSEAVSEFINGTGGNLQSTSPFQFMIGYLSMAFVCALYWVLQKFQGKKTQPGDEGYEDDHGYLPPIDEEGVDGLFKTWWEPAERALAMQEGLPAVDESTTSKKADSAASDPPDVEANDDEIDA